MPGGPITMFGYLVTWSELTRLIVKTGLSFCKVYVITRWHMETKLPPTGLSFH